MKLSDESLLGGFPGRGEIFCCCFKLSQLLPSHAQDLLLPSAELFSYSLSCSVPLAPLAASGGSSAERGRVPWFAANQRNSPQYMGFSVQPPWQELVFTGPSIHQAIPSWVQRRLVLITIRYNFTQRELRTPSSEATVNRAGHLAFQNSSQGSHFICIDSVIYPVSPFPLGH